MPASLIVDLDRVISQTALFTGQGAIDQFLQLLHAQRFELKDLRARDERTVDIEKGIVSGRSDQPQVSAFDIRQENVLLRFIEMMDLVDEQNRFSSGSAKTIGRRRDRAPHFRDI